MYTIYEIPGIKVGCDAKWPLRAIEQGVDPNSCNILQQETDLIQVSIDEMWWQIELGYPVDKIPYFLAVINNRRRAPKGGKIGGQTNKKSGQIKALGTEYGKKLGKTNLTNLNRTNKICPYCGKVANPGNYAQNHGDKCKSKP